MANFTRRHLLQSVSAAFAGLTFGGDASKHTAQDLSNMMARLEPVQNNGADLLAQEILREVTRTYRFTLQVLNAPTNPGQPGTAKVVFERIPALYVEVDPNLHTINPKTRLLDLDTFNKQLDLAESRKLDITNMTLTFPAGRDVVKWDFTANDRKSINDIVDKTGLNRNETLIYNDAKPYVKIVEARSVVGQLPMLANLVTISTGLLEQCQAQGNYAALDRAIQNALRPPARGRLA